ncbi:N-acetylmuramoyl-L-alanine amidase [Cellulophaga phage phi40:1]|uniref:N-acetylmuramoyl-L-alanine amidase n=1 Tax=Cellulophaga phage phi38:1 TaxID=1327977 RepID=S0A1P7_9CAUD|nr:endolysin [Cellulophaga phage phi38:1]AGO47948.1 N-acetylmuramoyl-L-alanine amidase [Cellulophaga phage phi40:1]AGO48113.1 N-acetylmuramoyl-L-alanine amidase [Cellulophaga phage phi38:1]
MIKNVVLDPGHGGIDRNGKYTTAPAKMYKFPNGEVAYEGVLNRAIAKEVARCLEGESGINVIFTVSPEDPKDVSLSERVRITNKYNSKETVFISIHCNASASHKGEGFEIYTTKGTTKSDRLAELIADSAEVSIKDVSMKLRYDLSDKDKDKESNFKVIRETNCPAVLIECGFFDNEKDFKNLKDPKFQSDLGSRIYTGILNYINENR